MFQYERGLSNDSSRLADDERELEFKGYGSVGRSNLTAALLTWGGRKIPLEFADVQRVDESTGEAYTLIGFDIGASSKVSSETGVSAFKFENSEERDAARLIAAEAILVHAYKRVEGYWAVEKVRVLTNGREWRASDFGYTSSASLAGDT